MALTRLPAATGTPVRIRTPSPDTRAVPALLPSHPTATACLARQLRPVFESEALEPQLKCNLKPEGERGRAWRLREESLSFF
jgi:hypothetical protein